jgi:alkanesulfonate monooxygenase SsuD/methylene tetrahydromethanopterin reductase-like flavin-dependent oxidoreductase (luciferase family)
MKREIRFNAFDMACVGHIQQGMWTHPRDRSADYLSLDYWMGLARLLEEGLFDGLFLADVLGIYDVHGGNGDAAIRNAVQVPLLRRRRQLLLRMRRPCMIPDTRLALPSRAA